MRNETEVLLRTEAYKKQLALAIEEKEHPYTADKANLDLIIFSLIDKLEILFWVLGRPLPQDDLLDSFQGPSH
ncbi:MAG: hypothetical protein K6B40_04150 [Firmicutes bacterium]|nr:hypothetical protein [Bacillota bacterium]